MACLAANGDVYFLRDASVACCPAVLPSPWFPGCGQLAPPPMAAPCWLRSCSMAASNSNHNALRLHFLDNKLLASHLAACWRKGLMPEAAPPPEKNSRPAVCRKGNADRDPGTCSSRAAETHLLCTLPLLLPLRRRIHRLEQPCWRLV